MQHYIKIDQSLIKEIIVVDGGSTDNTLTLLNAYPNVVCISEPDDGQSDAFNKGIKVARGDWVVLLDSDDELAPGTLRAYINTVSKKREIDVVYGHSQFIDADSNEIRKVISVPFRYENVIYDLAMPPSSGLFYRASLLKDNPMNINHHCNMDTEWYLRCGRKAQFQLIDRVTIRFRFWGENKTAALFSNTEIPSEILEERKRLKILYKDPYEQRIRLGAARKLNRYKAGIKYRVSKLYRVIKYEFFSFGTTQ